MKIPDITQQPVGEFALGNIRQPDYRALGVATGEFISAGGQALIELTENDTAQNRATAEAVGELSEIRAQLEESNTIDTDEIPDDIVHEVGATMTDLKGDRIEIGTPKTFTHMVADQIWAKRSEEIVQYWAGTISNRDDRLEFIENMTSRYTGPGTIAIGKATIIKRRAYNQAMAEGAIRDVAGSEADKATREAEANQIIDRQEGLGADPKWVEDQRSALGPLLDQLEIQNAIAGALTEDEINIIEENMWTGETRMSPEQLRTMSSQMDSRKREFERERKLRQTENADAMFKQYVVDETLTPEDVGLAVGQDDISKESGWTLYNAMMKGDTAKFNDPRTLSEWRKEIVQLKYTGNRSRVSQKAELLELMITRASMGLTPIGLPSNRPAPITGTEAFLLIKDIRAETDKILESDEYDNALKMVYTWSHVAVDLEGQITIALGGNQHQVDAALAFKAGLDNYMDQYGVDAKPVDYFHANRDAFSPNNFANGVNARFLEEVEQARPYITIDTAARTYSFDQVAQEEFVEWLADQVSTMEPAEFRRISTLFGQFYRGKGLAPFEGQLALEPDDPLYRQFEALLPQEP